METLIKTVYIEQDSRKHMFGEPLYMFTILSSSKLNSITFTCIENVQGFCDTREHGNSVRGATWNKSARGETRTGDVITCCT